ncbi:MAG: TetM/TetW/TetO/TetS family tetracycline resistance ribosomal protection protein [Atopobiaceae bacterium]|nr:TetM/TetW/TetO/TetS family tetracycline resistance ribosomal protection protein [Atopobiaceae bacterium]
MKQLVVGLLAHVDAGKTSLAEAMLYRAGAIRSMGRVDHGDSHMDVDEIERRRGITIFSTQARLEHAGALLMLVDAPGHVDFCAEAERAVAALDAAVLVVAANEGVRGHTKTMWRLLRAHHVPTVVFVNKCDLDAPSREELLEGLHARLDERCADAADEEALALTDEAALDELLETGELAPLTLRSLVLDCKAFPCLFGSARRDEGVAELMDLLALLARERAWPEGFSARVYKIGRGAKGERLAWIKVTGGELRAKEQLTCARRGGVAWRAKADQLRLYVGERFEVVGSVPAGQVCAAMGLAKALPGDALGDEPVANEPTLAPVLSYRVLVGENDVRTVHRLLDELAGEDPLLGVRWDERLQELRVQLMGAMQQDVVRDELLRRHGIEVDFELGGVLYKETLAAPSTGVGHFEPLRHYAEAHVLLEPTERGSGVSFGSVCPLDELDRNWQRLILGNAQEREHVGVLAGFPLTDVRITLLGGRAHLKHTEGGDFRQATYRAIRQALMEARERSECVLLEPWYAFELEVPADKVGRAMSDLQRMCARFGVPEMQGEWARIEGSVPVSEVRDYPLEVSAYTGGEGSMHVVPAGYEPCHDADRVIEEAAYDPVADLPNTPDSVFCSHGAGYNVPWNEVPAHAHVHPNERTQTPWRPASEV